MADCPTCGGSGKVAAHIANALSAPAGGTCHCDGPVHPYAPGWCPTTGPVR